MTQEIKDQKNSPEQRQQQKEEAKALGYERKLDPGELTGVFMSALIKKVAREGFRRNHDRLHEGLQNRSYTIEEVQSKIDKLLKPFSKLDKHDPRKVEFGKILQEMKEIKSMSLSELELQTRIDKMGTVLTRLSNPSAHSKVLHQLFK